jgi:hypothetical protein
VSAPSLSTRARAWFLRTFRGRSRAAAGWTDTPAGAVSSPPQTFSLGDLTVAATPKGIKAAGANPASAVWEVRVSAAGDARTWASSYGLPAHDNSAAAAAEIALDEVDQIWRDPDGWRAAVVAGLSEDEVEAVEDSPTFRLDSKAARWIGPHLDGVRDATKTATGRWLPA